MATVDQRVSKLEGAYEHLATKADLSDLKTELKVGLTNLKADLRGDLIKLIMGLAGLLILSMGVITTIIRFLD